MAYDDAGNAQNSITASLGAGPYNDLGYVTLQQYAKGITLFYQSGTTKRLLLTPSTNCTINSIDASGCSDGFGMLIVNQSASFTLFFPHLGGGISTNQFINVNSGSLLLPPYGSSWVMYVAGNWRFV